MRMRELDTLPDVDPTLEVVCAAMWPDEVCGAPADLMVRSHTHEGWFVCEPCWQFRPERRAVCRATYNIECRDEHAQIVRWLR